MLRLASLAVALASVSGGAWATELEARQGRLLAETHCAMCHATGRHGASPMPIARPLRDMHAHLSAEAIGEALAFGAVSEHPTMPDWMFDADQIDHLVAYLKRLQRPAR